MRRFKVWETEKEAHAYASGLDAASPNGFVVSVLFIEGCWRVLWDDKEWDDRGEEA